MFVPDNKKSVNLYLYHAGKTDYEPHHSISGRGITNVEIKDSELEAGMYMYTLIAKGMEIDTKRMILTK